MATTAPQRIALSATVKGDASQIFSKSNGGEYVLQNCVITQDGPMKGLVVSGTRTIKNADGKAKSIVPIGEKIQLYVTRMPSLQDPSKMMTFFEISTGTSASQDEINAKFDAMIAEQLASALGQ